MCKVCTKCKVEKDVTEFYKNKRQKDGLDFYCKECRNKQIRERGTLKDDYVRPNLEYVRSLKTVCQKCGEERLYLIQFHHVDPSKKSFMLSSPGTRSKAAIWEEASKCVCLCSNCHDEFHYLYGLNPKEPVKSLLEYLK